MNGDPSTIDGATTRRALSVRARLLLLCASLILSFASGSLYLTYLFERNHSDQLAVREQYRRFETILDVEQAVSLWRHRGGQLNSAMMLKDQPDEQLRRQADYEQARIELERRLVRIGSFDPDSLATIDSALREVPAYSQIVMQAMAQGHADTPDATRALAALQQRLNRIEETLEAARRREFEQSQQIQQQASDRAELARHIGLAITLLLLCSGVLLIVTVMRSILRPLRDVTNAMRQINRGLDPGVLPPVGGDEFGDMSQAMRLFHDRSERLGRLAYHDALTGLGNRAKLEESLEALLDQASARQLDVVLMYLDLDNFRSVNQRVGHRLGDRYLVEAVNRVQQLMPTGTQLFRYSGDKFVALLPIGDGGLQLEARIKSVASVVLRGVFEPYLIQNEVLNMSTSIGIAIYPDDGATTEQLISSAEAAVFAAKKSGRNNARFAGGKLAGQLRAQKALGNEIRRGLEHGEFEVYYQPIIDFAQRRVVAAEALMRWHHPDRGLLVAQQFISIAEEEGLIMPLAQLCLAQSHQQADIWSKAGHRWRIAVNVSAKQLQDGDILQQLRLLCAGIEPIDNRVDLELTESVLFDTSDEARELLNSIRRLGYRIGMDDFGTGYSSFNYLQWLPIDKIKIDRQFVSTMNVSRQARGIISATIALAQNLELDVVAEGVETPQQARQLANLGCPQQQGFHYSPALDAESFEQWAIGYAGRIREVDNSA
ncbi:diguanylate cyclase (GGDEF) domain-containing protein [Hydrocarboniphaga daqingensis]|uniref:Diguanylate cyclase (GGDEF) domain-containing protein n=1 Tax=Hydrocarboniphaga daqingensis TaxID=490188 RepID=A0A1M5NCX7_9GAMM|nr:EAL domain-containing protein [Hydrocarboniphaga daqingensis]SHG87315.1 diguanylate cyclase (GGDEF) domain-containing protein [Hydrocarboniphaga daqingensis]